MDIQYSTVSGEPRFPKYTLEEFDKKPSGVFKSIIGTHRKDWKKKLSEETIEQIESNKPITSDEFNQMRGNSYDWKTRYPMLDNITLLERVQYTLDNCTSIRRNSRFCVNSTYEESLLNSLVPILMDRLEEAEMYKRKTNEVLKDILSEQEWARMTYKDKLKFGLPEEQAIKNRERRYNGVFMTTISKLKGLIK